MQRTLVMLSFFVIVSLACSAGGLIPAATQVPMPIDAPAPTPAPKAVDSGAAGSPTLLFTIGMHIEPFGQTAQGFTGSSSANYNVEAFYNRHIQDIQAVAAIVEAHGGRMTIQTQSPFTTMTIQTQNPILADLAARGHELALHFHEDAHLGKQSATLPIDQWCAALKQEMDLIVQASTPAHAGAVTNIHYWSGGNVYTNLFQAAACAGLNVNSDWKNPKNQSTDLQLVGVNPWRPAGGTNGIDFTAFARHDPNGAVVFLPEGQFDQTDFASMRRSDNAGGDKEYFEYLKTQFYASLKASRTDKVNVFHFTVHPGEFRGDPAHPFAVIDEFLSEVVDPAAAAGLVQWATFSEMADAYSAWEQANPGADPR